MIIQFVAIAGIYTLHTLLCIIVGQSIYVKVKFAIRYILVSNLTNS